MRLVWKVAALGLWESVRDSVIQQDLCVELLLLQMKKSWLSCFSGVLGIHDMSPEKSFAAVNGRL